MLFCLGEPFNRMVKRLDTMQTRYIEIVDDGIQELNKKRVVALKEASKSYGLEYRSMHPSPTSTSLHRPKAS